MTRGRTICFPASGSFPTPLPQRGMTAELCPCPVPSCATQLTHPAELVQESLVLLGEFLDSTRLLAVGFAQVHLLLLQLVLQLLHVALQLRHPSFPLALLVLKSPPQFVFLLFQVLNDGGEEVRKGGKKGECLFFLIYARAKPCAGERMVLGRDNAMETAIPHQGRSLPLKPFSISSNWPVLGHWSSAHWIFTEITAKRVK